MTQSKSQKPQEPQEPQDTAGQIFELVSKGLSSDQEQPHSLTRMFELVDVLHVDSLGELYIPEGKEPTEQQQHDRLHAVMQSLSALTTAVLNDEVQIRAGVDAKHWIFRKAAKIHLRGEVLLPFLASLDAVLEEEGPDPTDEEFCRELMMASFSDVQGARGQHNEVVLSMAAAIDETLNRLNDLPSTETTFERNKRLFRRDTLMSFPNEFIIRQEPGEPIRQFANRVIWSAQEFGLELDAFFPYHCDEEDYS